MVRTFYIIVFILLFTSIYIAQKRERIYNNEELVESFLLVKEYIKKSLLTISERLLEHKKIKPSTSSINKHQLDQKINKLAKPIASSMIHFKRKGQILDQIQKMLSINNNNNSANMNYFLLPDTLLHQSKVDYYKDLVELIYEILGQRYETASFSDEESKLYIEGYST